VVVVAQATRLVRWIAVVGRNIDNLDQLKGKKVGVGPRLRWRGVLGWPCWDKLKLNPADYTVVKRGGARRWWPPWERGNIDAYARVGNRG